MLNLDDVRRYARIDDAEDAEVEELTKAAEEYIIGAIEVKDTAVLEESPVFRLCVGMLVSHWYDNRGVAADKAAAPLPLGVQSLLSQLAQLSPEVTAE